jgi:phosphate transport system protein
VMYETRHQFHHELDELEARTLEGLDLVVGQLDWALDSVRGQDVELAALVIADDDRIDGRYLEVHQGVLSLLACQAPVAGDLRRIAALLHVIRCIERMGDQCVNIAKLVPLAGEQAPGDSVILGAIERMGQLARRDVTATSKALKSRDLAVAHELIGQGARIGRVNREIFNRAVQIGENVAMREWAMFMILVGRALERIGDNAVAVAEQTVFVVTGVLGGLPDASRPV